MRLHGLFAAALADPALVRARELAAPGAVDADQVDITAPASTRAVVAAVLAQTSEGGGAGRPVLAVTATTREAEDLAAGSPNSCPPDAVAVYPAWETCRTSGSRPAATPSGAGWPCCAGWPTRGGRRGRPAARGGGAGPVGAAAAAEGPGRPGAGRAATPAPRPTSTRWCGGWPTSPTPAPTWSPSAASSPSAAASSTCSRPPRSTRCGWSSGATRSRRSARFAVADQRTLVHGGPAVGAALPRAAAHPGRPGRGRASWRSGTRSWPRCWTSWPRASRSRGWSRWRPRCSTASDSLELVLHCMPAQHDGAAVRPGADPDPGARPGPHQRGVPAGELGRGRRRGQGAGRPRRGRVPVAGRGAGDCGGSWASRGGR